MAWLSGGAVLAASLALLAPGCANHDESAAAPERQPVIETTESLAPKTVVTLVANRDTSIRSTLPNRNFGRDDILEVNRALIGFDQNALRAALGPQDTLDSASLQLTLANNDVNRNSSARIANLFRLTSAWTENGATFNCAIDSRPGNDRINCSGANRWSMEATPPNPWVTPATDTATIVAPSKRASSISMSPPTFAGSSRGPSTTTDGWCEAMWRASSSSSLRAKRPPLLRSFSASRAATPRRATTATRARSTDAAPARARTPRWPTERRAATATPARRPTRVRPARAPAATPSPARRRSVPRRRHLRPGTGAARTPRSANGTACNDGNACTQTDTCQAGACAGANPVVCTASDQCHAAGTCDPARAPARTRRKPTAPPATTATPARRPTRARPAPAPARTPSSARRATSATSPARATRRTGAARTRTAERHRLQRRQRLHADRHVPGRRVHRRATRSCARASDQCHARARATRRRAPARIPTEPTAPPATTATPAPRPTPARPAPASAANPVVCTASDQCHAAGICNPATGTCSNPAAPDGTACNDGNGCTTDDTCQRGRLHRGPRARVPATERTRVTPALRPGRTVRARIPSPASSSVPVASPRPLVDGLDVSPLTLAQRHAAQPDRRLRLGDRLHGRRQPVPRRLPIADRPTERCPSSIAITRSSSPSRTASSPRSSAAAPRSTKAPGVPFHRPCHLPRPHREPRSTPKAFACRRTGTFSSPMNTDRSSYEFDATGNLLRSLSVPAEFLVSKQGTEDAELPPGNSAAGSQPRHGRARHHARRLAALRHHAEPAHPGRRAQRLQQARRHQRRILEDRRRHGRHARVPLPARRQGFGLNEILAVNDHQFLVIERDGDGGARRSSRGSSSIDLAGATDISGIESLPARARLPA